MVRNDYIEEYAGAAKNPANEIHRIEEADHTNICFHAHYASHMIRASIAFLDKLVGGEDSL